MRSPRPSDVFIQRGWEYCESIESPIDRHASRCRESNLVRSARSVFDVMTPRRDSHVARFPCIARCKTRAARTLRAERRAACAILRRVPHRPSWTAPLWLEYKPEAQASEHVAVIPLAGDSALYLATPVLNLALSN